MSTLFFLMLFFVLTADGLMLFLTPVIVYQLTGSIEYSGLSYALWWSPRIIIIPLMGKYIDRLGVRPLSVMSDLVKSSGCLFLALSNFSSDLIIAMAFGIVGSLISVGNSQTIISYEKLVSVISAAKEHHANLISRMDFLGMVVGPIIGMIMIDYGFRILLILPCILYLINALFFIIKKKALRYPDAPDKIEHANDDLVNTGSRSSINYIFSIPILLFTVLMAIGNNMFDGLVESTGTALIDRNMGLPVKYFGLIDVAAGLCGVAGTYLYGALKNNVNRKQILLAAIVIITGASLSLIIWQSSFAVFVCCYALSIVGKVFTGNICRMLRIELINPAVFASVSSIITLLNHSVLPLIGLIIYLSGDSTRAIYYFMAIAIVIAFTAGICLYRNIKPVSEHAGIARVPE